MKKEKATALVVLSGGQDSTTCLGIALNKFERVQAISFDYGQKHLIELECARKVCKIHGVPLKEIKLSFLKEVVTSSLIDDKMTINGSHPNKTNLPSTFVPNRNALFLTIAHAHAQEIKSNYVFMGVCETDFSGYPDCRENFIDELNTALNTGYEADIYFETPLMHLTKREIFHMARKNNFLSEVLEISHTCYEGERLVQKEWGYGCGDCAACMIRKNGYFGFTQDLKRNENKSS